MTGTIAQPDRAYTVALAYYRLGTSRIIRRRRYTVSGPGVAYAVTVARARLTRDDPQADALSVVLACAFCGQAVIFTGEE